MDTNTRKRKCGIVMMILLGLILLDLLSMVHSETNFSLNQTNQPTTSAAEDILIDKVYTVLSPSDSLHFDDLLLIEEYCYYTTLEIVSPHNCEINLTIIDPELNEYEAFNTEVNISQSDGWFEVPFGVAIGGNYSFIFTVMAEFNLNIHIKLEKEHKCLYDILNSLQLNNLELYNVNRFSNNMPITHNLNLRTDYSYKFFIGRVSSIGGDTIIENEVSTFYNLTDPDDTEFKIYANETLESVGGVLHFDFGTAIAGVYSVEIIIFSKVEHVNIAYAVVEDFRIGDVVNGTVPEPGDNLPPPRLAVASPIFIASLVFICFMFVGGFAMYLVRKRVTTSLKLQ